MTAAIAAALALRPAGFAQAQTAPSPATTAPQPPEPAKRLLDPAAVLRAATSTQLERDESARRLVQRRTPEAREVLLAALQDVANRPGQLAAASALIGATDPDSAYIIPLFALIGTSPDRTDVAIAALASYRADRNVASRLIDFAVDPAKEQRLATRVAAIRAVGTMSDKSAAAALVGLVGSDAAAEEVRAAAAAALTEMTGVTGGQDAAQWQRWWSENQNKPDAEFEHDILAARAARLTVIQQRFSRVVDESARLLSEAYQSAPERNREAILLRYLRSPEPEMRLVGVQLVQDDFKQNRPIPPTARERLRSMVGDSSARVRIAVAMALTLLNDPGAVAAVLEQLKQEPDADVRAALVQTLAPTRDLQVIDPLLTRLRDPSPTVALHAAEGLRDLGPLIQKDPAMSRHVAQGLRETLEARTGPPGTAPLRAALVDAMGTLQNAELRSVLTRLLRPGEAVSVRRASLRALGNLQQPWAAEIIVNSLDDPDEDVRLEAINALDSTANFNQADKLYSVLKNPTEKPEIRQRAWDVLRNRFRDSTASNQALYLWADRFKDEPERRIEILEVLRDRLTAEKDLGSLATVQQNIGEAKMKLAATALAANDPPQAKTRAEEADKYFELALAYYQGKADAPPMVTSALLEQRMDALLTSHQYGKAADFAATSIARSAGNQEAMGRRLRDEIDRLRTNRQYSDAVSLIDAVYTMKPPLAEPFLSRIRAIETEVRQRVAAGAGAQPTAGNGQ